MLIKLLISWKMRLFADTRFVMQLHISHKIDFIAEIVERSKFIYIYKYFHQVFYNRLLLF